VAQSSGRIVVVPGDGIGPEVIEQGLRALDVLNRRFSLGLSFAHKDWGADKWIKEGIGLPKGTLDDLQNHAEAIYFGALGDPRIPDMAHGREILLGLRFGLDLYVNMRPVRLIEERYCPLKNEKRAAIDMVIFRENTEDLYVGKGSVEKKGSPDEVATDISLHTRKGVERVVRHAFEYARQQHRKTVTLADKSNAIRFGGDLWQRVFWEVAKDYPDIQAKHLFIDVMAMEFVRAPERFDVVVTSNVFGDILTDLGAGLVGGLGLAASANMHPGRIGLFEPVHGSAPDIAGKGKANPMAAMFTAALMLEFLGAKEAGKALDAAVVHVLKEGYVTPDLGGNLTTIEVANYILKALN